jgi:4a-hydroxytetrahydrobiopterin dehydratase
VALPNLDDIVAMLPMTDFADRKCKPCEGGVAPLTTAQALKSLTALHADWKLSEDGKSIARIFDFPAFSRTIAFTNAVAWIATVEGHHPEMTVNYGRCVVAYKTTAIDGLSDNDFICAAKIDRIAGNA